MSLEKIDKYPFISRSQSLSIMWSNDDFPFSCMKASKVIASILAEKINFKELLIVLGTIRKIIAPIILNPQNRNEDLDNNKQWLVSFLYQTAQASNPELSFYSRWINAYKKYESHFLPDSLGVYRTSQANTRIFKKSRYEDMIEELSLRFEKQSTTNVLDVKGQDSELDYSLITRISHKKYFVQHTPPSSFSKSQEVLSELLNDILSDNDYTQNEEKFSLFIKKVAYLNWHLNQAMFYERGSATITELLTTAIFIFKGLALPEYKERVSCDLIALFTSSPDSFANEFRSFFTWPHINIFTHNDINTTCSPNLSNK